VLAGNAQGRAARREHRHAWRLHRNLGDLGRRGQEVLDVIDHQ
jgi:hypothetical protein